MQVGKKVEVVTFSLKLTMSYTAYCVGSCSDNVMREIGQNYNKKKRCFWQTCNLLITQSFISKFTAKLIVEANGNHTNDLMLLVTHISVFSGTVFGTVSNLRGVQYFRAQSQVHPAFFVVGS